ncbi:ATP-dependent helicase [Clostridioides difficile]|uniref:ATP-dependent helicase n=1 Tax=Clostridioides difficile TaxID=1496 RepID=UPI000401BD01|nr:ATP-dependent helicase [Clostridioides difficile]
MIQGVEENEEELVSKEDWSPAAGFRLEVEAMNTVINDKNTLVVAGPGAGKTDLLAQRACFLLETNTCRYPKKILAISFKKDAAENLKERLELRCGKELASRFESKTYDAFAKEIVDRFRNSLDEAYRPLNNYNIAENRDVRRAFEIAGLNFRGNQTEFNKVYGNKLSINKLPLHTDFVDKIFIDAWNVLLKGNKDNNFVSSLTFGMISRLAEYLIRTNRYIKKAIEMTYSHVFLDEFQDTKSIQYDLVKACFFKTETIITAVGDGKQRIMLWAGARKSIFEDFQNDFLSQKRTLIMNHRSAPRLVEIQKAMYNSLNEEAIDLKTNEKWNYEDGEVYLRLFEDYIKEADILSEEIVELVETGIEINEICILVKQSVDIYSKEIINKLSERNIKARNEAMYQEILKEDIIKTLVSLFRLSLSDRNPDDWDYIYDIHR